MGQVEQVGKYNRVAYFYADPLDTDIGEYTKDATSQIMCRIDYSALTIPPGDVSVDFTVDIGSNPLLAVTSSYYNQTENYLDFILSGGIAGQKYVLSISLSGTITRIDTITIDVPSIGCECEPLSTVHNEANYTTSGGVVYINSAIKFIVSSITPTGVNVLDEWFNPESRVLYKYITDGTNFWWQAMVTTAPSTPLTFQTMRLKHIVFDGINSLFTLVDLNSNSVNVLASTDLVVSLDGVIQQPDVDYVAFADQVQFAQVPRADSYSFIVWYQH
jgi:hypothetical protein